MTLIWRTRRKGKRISTRIQRKKVKKSQRRKRGAKGIIVNLMKTIAIMMMMMMMIYGVKWQEKLTRKERQYQRKKRKDPKRKRSKDLLAIQEHLKTRVTRMMKRKIRIWSGQGFLRTFTRSKSLKRKMILWEETKARTTYFYNRISALENRKCPTNFILQMRGNYWQKSVSKSSKEGRL